MKKLSPTDPSARTILRTPRLDLREMTLDDLDFVASMLADPAVMRFYPKTYSRAEADRWIARRIEQYLSHGYSLWLVQERQTGAPVGQVGLVPQLVEGVEEAEIGYLIASMYWRRGYASEAAAGVRDHAFGELGKDRVISLIRPDNTPSRGVAARIGHRLEGRTTHAGMEHLVYSSTPEGRGSPPPACRATPTTGPLRS